MISGVEQDVGTGVVVEVVDEDPLLDADLRRGQADAGRGVHRLDHVLGELDQRAVDVGDVLGHPLEHGVADDPDLVRDHGRQGYRRADGVPTAPRGGARLRAVLRAGRRPFARGPAPVHLTLPDVDLELGTDRGVFSAERVDAGTELLLRGARRPAGRGDDAARRRLRLRPDRGHAARRAPAATVWAVDVNERALDLCRANAERHGVGDRVRAVTPDEVPDDVRFDGLWSNPPIRAGKAHLHELLERWLARLAPRRRGPPRGAQAPRLRLARPLADRPRGGRPSG